MNAMRKANKKQDRIIIPIEQPVSQAMQAYVALENLIVMGDLKAGAWLSELSLANSLGIGRTPVRESLKLLERDNLVEIVPSRGIRVKGLHTHEQLQMLDARRPLDKMIARRAAALGSDEQKRELIEKSQVTLELTEAGNYTTAMSANSDCCRIVWEMCGNPYLVQAIRPLFSSTRRFFIHYADTSQILEVERLHHAHALSVARGSRRDVDRCSDKLMDFLEGFAHSVLDKETKRVRGPFSRIGIT